MINLDANFPSRSHNGAKVLVHVVFARYVLHPREKLSAFAQKIVVQVNTEQSRAVIFGS